MATLTMRHARGDDLTDLWDAKAAAWASVRQSSALRRPVAGSDLDVASLAGYVVKTEVTDGDNGWHLHLHVLVFMRCGPAEASVGLDAWCAAARPLWGRTLGRRGYAPGDEHGLRVALIRRGHEAGDVAAYVSKDGAPAEAVAREMALDVGKSARGRHRNQWGLLGGAIAGDGVAAARWAEWESSSKGRRAIVWTKALRRELLTVPDLTDEELAAVDEPAVGLVGLHGESWRVVRRSGGVCRLLDAAEDGYRVERDAGGSHWQALQAAQDDVVGLLCDFGVPEHRFRALRLPVPLDLPAVVGREPFVPTQLALHGGPDSTV